MRITKARAARNLAYIEAELERSLPPERRAHLTGKADWYRKVLAGSCSRCGRTLTDPESLARGCGSECAKALA